VVIIKGHEDHECRKDGEQASHHREPSYGAGRLDKMSNGRRPPTHHDHETYGGRGGDDDQQYEDP
jgi:hypothetical protein